MEGEKANYDLVYFDCFSGVAGDMMLASMFDAVPIFFFFVFLIIINVVRTLYRVCPRSSGNLA